MDVVNNKKFYQMFNLWNFYYIIYINIICKYINSDYKFKVIFNTTIFISRLYRYCVSIRLGKKLPTHINI